MNKQFTKSLKKVVRATKMNFKCKVQNAECTGIICGQLLSTENETLNHFKVCHKLKEKTHEFPCFINNDCEKQYLTLKGLKNHAKKCLESR